MPYGLSVRSEHGMNWDYDALDGDSRDVGLVDETPDDGLNPRGRAFTAGRRVDPTNVPTKVRWKDSNSPLAIPDFSSGPFLHVSAKAKALVEQFEPGLHQFLPVEFVNSDGSFLEQRWFFCVCNRLDSVDRTRVQGMLLSGGRTWRPAKELMRNYPEEIPPGYDLEMPPKLVFNLEQIGNAHFWCDKHLTVGGPFMSDKVVAALKASGCTGLSLDGSGVEAV